MNFFNYRGLGSSPLHRLSSRSALLRRSGVAQEYNRPSGWLFAEKPLKPGQKRRWEWWEPYLIFGYGGSYAVFFFFYQYKPDTTVQSWALYQAQKRMAERGETYDYPHTELKW
ncbi:hypothetical protein H4R34_004131 [Dimargaris verticillata]|uniref:NADH dehydrogenase [ubiquinone] 1 beta subcomplex subunit 11, mitochondrial n=1 Tax=Dimargaris verticillata TaxID=2761393 RepID=A0A9W8AZF7_9FUNG|nr:hypothetical protein H4R35_007380 [Dimargaris xerosporica]KAJ1976016.1 hypothetical protein H4R34_004131 [Dimargaris verticillata]